jgi:hypothetical protein
MREALLLLWLRWRHTQEELIYWVRSGLYYDPRKRTTAERLYGLYVLVLIVVVFLLPGWVELLATATAAGHALPPHLRVQILGALPAAILCWQVVLTMAALRSSPLKLTYPDMAYVAGAPLPRGAAILIGFLFMVMPRLLVAMLMAGLVAVALTQPAALGSATRTCGEAAVGIVPLAVLSWGAAWLAGCARVASYKVQRWRFLWLAPLLVLGPAALFPGALLWSGRTLTLAMQAQVSSRVGLLALVATLALATLPWIGNRVNMTLVAEESQLYARLKSLGLGLMTLFVAPGLSWQMRAQERLRAQKPRGRLPRATGSWALVARAALSGLRHPFVLIRPLLWGVVVTRLSAFLLLEHVQVRVWVYWLIAVVITAPRSLVTVFKADTAQPFLRQFLPVNTLQLLLADTALPFLLLLVGTLAAWIRQPAAPSIVLGGAGLSVVMAVVLALCQGLGLVPLMAWRIRTSSALATGTSFGAVLMAGLLTKTLVVPLGVGMAIAALLGGLLATSP